MLDAFLLFTTASVRRRHVCVCRATPNGGRRVTLVAKSRQHRERGLP